MSVILHISDPHFGTEQAPVVQALFALAQQQRPHWVVLSGDITQRARPAQFAAARAFIEQLGVPVLAIPGNHDIPLFNLWQRLRRPYAQHVAAFGADLEPVHSGPDLMLLGVNTTRAWRHKNGEVSRAQIRRVAQQLATATPAQLRVVVVHQPVAVTLVADVPHLLRGSASALASWAAAGADLVLGGHIHLPYVMALPGHARPMWAVQAGTSVSRRVRPGVPNSVNLLRWGADAVPGCCSIEQWDFSAAESSFLCAKTTEVSPERA
jgi:3',5'-cyclic AMP phosphodiesterase CpdA